MQSTLSPIRIGTRRSPLAIWQAHVVQVQLEALGYATKLVKLSSAGDQFLETPLHQMGNTGIFTKALDIALLSHQIDLAVHSLKDVPTSLPASIVPAAILKRGVVEDVLVYKKNTHFLDLEQAIIATGSLRRQAQWLHKYPKHRMVPLRGNVNARLQKLESNEWDGAIFAKVGLERLGLLPQKHCVLDWMIPAPGQGALMITSLSSSHQILEACHHLHHKETALKVGIEREFMSTLEGGCTAPIGAYAELKGDTLLFRGVFTSIDGSVQFKVNKTASLSHTQYLGKKSAEEILAQGGEALRKSMIKSLSVK